MAKCEDSITRHECEKCQAFLLSKIEGFKNYVVGFGLSGIIISIISITILLIKL